MKPLHGNLYFFLIRASRGPFRLKHKHRVPLTYIFLRENSSWGACGKIAYLFIRERESALISRRYGVPGFFILLLYWNWCSYRQMGVSGNLWMVVKDVKTLVVYDVEWETAMDSMKGKCASSWVDLVHGAILHFCGDLRVPLDFSHATRWGPIPLRCMQSNFVFPIKHIRSLDLLDWTLESPQQHCHKTRRTLMSPQEAKLGLVGQYGRYWRWGGRPSVPY